MSGPRVLIVDDELYIRRLLRRTLERAGYAVEEAVDAAEALSAVASARPAAVLLDLGLPDRDGLELITPLKKDCDLVILVVSAREDTEEKVAALDLGADDYVTKPFDAEELLARLRVALRNHGRASAPPRVIKASEFVIDLERRVVCRDAEELHLTRKEHDVLSMLAATPGRVVTHQRILEAAWPHDDDRPIENLRIVIRNLRQKLEGPGAVGSVIANELGIGYRLLLGA